MPTFTKKHYQIIADEFHTANIFNNHSKAEQRDFKVLEAFAIQLCDRFKIDNQNFHEDRFMIACGFEERG